MPENQTIQETEELTPETLELEPPTVENSIEEMYDSFNHIIRATAQGFQRSTVIKAKAGIGKTYQITNVLDEEETDYIKISGHITPLALYQKMAANQESVIFLDDCSAVLKDRQSMELLKAATETDVDTRTVSWESNTHDLPDDVKTEFDFEGQLIICANQIPDSGSTKEIVDSVLDRSIYMELDLSYRERIDLIKQVAYITQVDEIDAETRMEIANWIENVSDKTSSGVNLRTLFKCFNLYRYNSDKWSELAREEITVDPEVAYVADALGRHDTVKEACEDYIEHFDKSRSSFYRRKSALEQ